MYAKTAVILATFASIYVLLVFVATAWWHALPLDLSASRRVAHAQAVFDAHQFIDSMLRGVPTSCSALRSDPGPTVRRRDVRGR